MSLINCDFKLAGRTLPLVMDLDNERVTEAAIRGYLANGIMYEPDVSAIMFRILAEGDIAIDVGANVGYFTLLMGLISGPRGHVVAFEPGDENVQRLRANLALTGLENVTMVETAASAQPGELTFFINSDNAGGSALWDPAQYPGNVKCQENPLPLRIQATTIDAEMERLGLDAPKLIKIDTEGAEHEVLKGARKLLATGKVPYIVAELHEFGLDKMGSSQMELRGFMAQFGYETFAMYNNGTMPKMIPRDTTITSRHMINILFSTPKSISRIWPVEIFDQ
jgi:FkbM family methyltransferase